MAQLEHQAVRIENLELMSQYGTNAWKVYNEYVTAAPLCQLLAVKFVKRLNNLSYLPPSVTWHS